MRLATNFRVRAAQTKAAVLGFFGSTALAALSAGTPHPAQAQQIEASVPEIIDKLGTAQVIVVFKQRPRDFGEIQPAWAEIPKAPPDDQVLALKERITIPPKLRQSVTRLGALEAASMTVDKEALEDLKKDETVDLIAPDRANWPLLSDAMPLSGLDRFWSALPGGTPPPGDGSDTVIAILDTGIDPHHPFFAGKIARQACFSRNLPASGISSLCPSGKDIGDGRMFEESPEAATLCPLNVHGCGHGLHVAGIAAGATVPDPRNTTRTLSGLARGAKIFPIQVFSKFENQNDCGNLPAPCARALDSSIIDALHYVQQLVLSRKYDPTAPNIVAVNLSLGIGTSFAPCDDIQPLALTISQLRQRHIPTFIASGNDGQTAGVSSPACVSAAVSVGASTKEGKIWTSTNRAKGLLDIVAPGVDIYSAAPGAAFKSDSGTSMAAPVMAGVYAALQSRYNDRTVEDILAALHKSAHVVLDTDLVTKYRRVDAFGAHEILKTGLPVADTDGVGAMGAIGPMSAGSGKRFILNIDPSYAPNAVTQSINRNKNAILRNTGASGLEVQQLTSDSLVIETSGSVDRNQLKEGLRAAGPGVKGLFVAPEAK